MMRTKAIASALLVVMTACSSGQSQGAHSTATSYESAPKHAVSQLPVIPVTVTHDGKKHSFRVEVAGSAEEQDKGLMFRTAMGANEGMIFPMEPARSASFWMKNTVIPLDLVFIGPDKRIESIGANAVPYSLSPIGSRGSVSAVLELNGGRAAQLGLATGDRVEW